jgi:hypothetical protein
MGIANRRRDALSKQEEMGREAGCRAWIDELCDRSPVRTAMIADAVASFLEKS